MGHITVVIKLKCEHFTVVPVKKMKFTPEKAMKAQKGRSTPHPATDPYSLHSCHFARCKDILGSGAQRHSY